ncbi:MAG: hypothetical protein CCU26_03340 [Nitrospira sp. UW-LDO-01]|nr:MAG: hypothetical protein CCU26_03340 [Nitrospira sp. UW-LDO-01]
MGLCRRATPIDLTPRPNSLVAMGRGTGDAVMVFPLTRKDTSLPLSAMRVSVPREAADGPFRRRSNRENRTRLIISLLFGNTWRQRNP